MGMTEGAIWRGSGAVVLCDDTLRDEARNWVEGRVFWHCGLRAGWVDLGERRFADN